MDYAIWGALQQNVYIHRKFITTEQLKLAVMEEWRKLSKHFIDKSINKWRKRLNKVVENQGGHIEHVTITIQVHRGLT